MPRGDGTGPRDQGPKTGKGMTREGQGGRGRKGGFAPGPWAAIRPKTKILWMLSGQK